MKIAINTRLLLNGRLEGIGWFVYETLHRMVKAHPEHEYHLIFDRPYDKSLIPAGCLAHKIAPQARHPFLFYIWFEISLPALLRKINPDVFLSPDSFLSIRSKVKSVQVLHDINFEHQRFGIPYLKYKYYRYFFPRFAKRADRIATVSEYSKQDITKTYKIDENKIDVVYSGLNERYGVLSEQSITKTRERLTEGLPYFIYIGSLHGRKNVGGLMQAYDLFRKSSECNYKLLIAGEKMFRDDGLSNVFHSLEFKEDIIFTGRISNEELRNVLGSAFTMVFVSLFEGFGLPILEAFQAGIPLICSNRTSLPEVAGDAAILVDPQSNEEIAQAMQTVLDQPELRKKMISEGLKRKDLFTWDITAEKLYQTILRTL